AEVVGVGGSCGVWDAVVDVAVLGGDQAAGCLADAVADGHGLGEGVGAEPAGVFVGEHVSGDGVGDHAVPVGVAGGGGFGDPGGRDIPPGVGGLGESGGGAGEDVGVDHDRDVRIDRRLGGV